MGCCALRALTRPESGWKRTDLPMMQRREGLGIIARSLRTRVPGPPATTPGCSARQRISRHVGSLGLLQVLPEPGQDQFCPADPVLWRPGAGQLVVLAGIPVHDRVAAKEPQRDEQLLGLADRAAQIVFGVQDEQRGGHVADIADRRLTQVGAGIGEMVWAHVAADEAGDIGAVLHGEQVVAGALGAGRPESAGVPDGPGGHEAAVGAAEDTEPVWIDPAETLAGGFDAGHDVRVVRCAPAGAWILRAVGAPDGPAPLLAVAGAAPRVAVQDAEASGGLQLEIVDETVAVLGEGAAVHI